MCTCDAVLEWISIYWFSRAGPAASSRIYYEMLAGGTREDPFVGTRWTSVPVGVSRFPGEPVKLPESYVSPSFLFMGVLTLAQVGAHDRKGGL